VVSGGQGYSVGAIYTHAYLHRSVNSVDETLNFTIPISQVLGPMDKSVTDSPPQSKASDPSDADDTDELGLDVVQNPKNRTTHMPLWKYFDRGEMVSSTSASRVRWAVCKACATQIQGQAPTMKTHLMRCYAVDEDVRRECSGTASLGKGSAWSATHVVKHGHTKEDGGNHENLNFLPQSRTDGASYSPHKGQTSTMRGIVLNSETGQLECQSLPIVEIKDSPGTARVRVVLAGLCSTDLELVQGYKSSPRNMILGHEFVGIIDQIRPLSETSDDTNGFAVGDRVCAEINCTKPGLCHDWKVRSQHDARSALGIFGAHGVFAEFVKVPIENLHRIASSISDRAAVFAEPLAAACQVLEEIHIRKEDRVGVLGAGKLGSLVAGVLTASMFDVFVLVRPTLDGTLVYPRHLSSITQRSIPVRNSVSEADNSYDCIIECTGNPGGLQRALALVKPRGTIVLKSTYSPTKRSSDGLDLSAIVVKEVRVIGSRCGPFKTALRMLEENFVSPEVLIFTEYDLADAKEAFRQAAKPKALKVLFKP
jgi:threonine dehydrogenase-like Zn-dependent dehydrogenase